MTRPPRDPIALAGYWTQGRRQPDVFWVRPKADRRAGGRTNVRLGRRITDVAYFRKKMSA